MKDEIWILMGTEHVDKDPHSMDLVFLGEESGDIRKIRRSGIKPYAYVLVEEETLKQIPEVREVHINERTNEWKSNFEFEEVDMIHPITQERIKITKVYADNKYDLFNWKNFNGLLNFLPKKIVFNSDDKYADYFLRELDLIMGMPYRITEDGIEQVESIFDEEVQEVIDRIKPAEIVKYALTQKFTNPFFVDFPDIGNHIIAIDIEVDNDYKQAIQPEEAKYPISSIAIYTTIKSFVFTLSDEVRGMEYEEEFEFPDDADFDYIVCDSEKELLYKATRLLVKKLKMPIVTTFNGDRFDMIYWCTRMHVLKIHEFDRYIWGRYDSYKDRYIKGFRDKFLMDLYPFFKNPSIKIYAFKNSYFRNRLKDITDALLGVTKYEFEGEISGLQSKELAYYNYIDTKRTHELCTFNDNITMNLIFMLMRVSGRTFEDVHRRMIGTVVKGVTDNVLFYSDILQPNRVVLRDVGNISSNAIIEGKKYEGAVVFDPDDLDTVGFWTNEDIEVDIEEPVVCADFSSLYPSEIKERNLCFSTINCEHDECKDNIMPTLTHHVCEKRDGIVAGMIGFIRDIRVYYFKQNADKYPTYSVVEQVLKVLINASYGVFGDDRFTYYTAPLAEGTTAYGRDDILKTKKYVEENGVKVLYGDSVRGNTPVMIRDNVGNIYIDYIRNIKNVNGLQVYTEDGWTGITSIIKHRVKKRMYRILTHTGFIEVTQDHSLLDKNGNEVRPEDVNVGFELLHSFPVDNNTCRRQHSRKILDKAWCYGIFVADGTCGIYDTKYGIKYSWNIGKDEQSINEIYNKFSYVYDWNFKILDVMKSSGVYRLVPKGNIKYFVGEYNKFYTDDKLKRISDDIINSCMCIKQSFFDGYYFGDGDKSSNSTRTDTNSLILAQGLYKIGRDIGYKISLNTRSDKENIIRLNYTKNDQKKNPYKIKKIIDLGIKDEVVYDFETKNHHFHAGVGQMIVHNTDSVYLFGATEEFLKQLFEWVIKKLKLEMGIDYKGKFMCIWKKKSYFVDNHGRLVVKGLTGKKSNTPDYVQECFYDVLDIVEEFYYDKGLMRKKIYKLVDEYLMDLYAGNVNPKKLSKTVRMGKTISTYDKKYPHVVAGKKLAEFYREKMDDSSLPDEVLIPKDTYIEYVIASDGEVIPIQMVDDDTILYVQEYSKKFIRTLRQVLIPLGLNIKKFQRDYSNRSLDDFF